MFDISYQKRCYDLFVNLWHYCLQSFLLGFLFIYFIDLCISINNLIRARVFELQYYDK